MLGIWNKWDEESFKKQKEEGKEVSLGYELNGLYDQLNFLELQHGGNPAGVVLSLKQDLMMRLGKIAPPEEQPKPEEEAPSADDLIDEAAELEDEDDDEDLDDDEI